MHHAFLYISLPLLHDYDVKPPNFMFFGGREHMAIWSEILAGNNFIVCDLEEVRESMRSWEKNPFINYEYEVRESMQNKIEYK